MYRPDQKKEHDNAITYFFVMVNVGATFSMIGTPILRNVIGCLGKPTCYALPWSVVFIAVVISLLLFMFCLGAVNKKQVREENSMVRVYKCLRGAINSDENETKEECLAKNPGTISLKDYEDDDKIGPLGMCLDNSYPRFSRRFIFDVRQVGSDCRKIKEAGSQNETSNFAIRDRLGGVYAILFHLSGEDTMEFEVVELMPPPKVSVCQASPFMKSVINGILLLTGLFGNIVNIGVHQGGRKLFESHDQIFDLHHSSDSRFLSFCLGCI
ncbi:hypothetical protein QR680_009094 [Steinernema hermaphroditum]|uniref:Uncharacterized protein n=1 Tax=Steinernema hermaphroditum TaxID=289476 RepID=A0AA39IKG0_9BILA|nr:hypothetical protein QR680_009094 [Steinernema hermaphroditum]